MDADLIIEAYVLQLLDGHRIKSVQDFLDFQQEIVADFPAWDDFKLWVEDTQKTSLTQRARRSFTVQDFTLGRIIDEVQELNDRLGAFQNIECRSLKTALSAMEYKNTGRVSLHSFYQAGLHGRFFFNEHVSYLRKLGALDETEPNH